MQTTLAEGHSFTDNDVTLVVNNQMHALSLSAQPVSGDFILLELTPLDSHRRITQEQLQQAQQAAARDLVRGLAHEIKNPLGGLRGAAQLLSRALPDPALQEYTQVIIEQADRLRALVDRLLGPQHPGQKSLQSIHHVAERVFQLINLEKPDNITLVKDYDPSLPELSHYPDQIEQVILNIMRNALEALHSAGGTIILRTRTAFQVMLHGERYRLAARIDIEDNGPGIPPELQEKIFIPFFTTKSEGSGIGLSLCKQIIRLHDGHLTIQESNPGKTIFHIDMPL